MQTVTLLSFCAVIMYEYATTNSRDDKEGCFFFQTFTNGFMRHNMRRKSSFGGNRQSIRNPEDAPFYGIIPYVEIAVPRNMLTHNYSHTQQHQTLTSCTPV